MLIFKGLPQGPLIESRVATLQARQSLLAEKRAKAAKAAKKAKTETEGVHFLVETKCDRHLYYVTDVPCGCHT